LRRSKTNLTSPCPNLLVVLRMNMDWLFHHRPRRGF
jgi:hypothetical protein